MPKSDTEIEPCPSRLEHQQLLDEQLPAWRYKQVVDHLQRCNNCQTLCESLIDSMEYGHRSTIVEGVYAFDKINRIVELVKQRIHSSTPWPENQAEVFTLDPADLEQLQGEYPLIKQLGRGGQGMVYMARDASLCRDVVIKLLSTRLQASTDSVERFKREARLLASVQSKYVVPIHRVGSLPSGRLYMVMEYVNGITLRQLHQSQNRLSYQQIATIIQQIALGLSAAHQKRLVHRDIKPENVLIQSSDSTARIVDFGLAFDTEEENRITVDGAIAGTPAYMSPEQINDPSTVSYSTDVYSLGVVLYELLVGEVPFRGTARMTLLRSLHEDPIAPRVYNDQIPRDLETICLRAMCKDRTKRFRSAQQLADELQRFLDGQPIESRPVGQVELAWRRIQRNPMVSALVGSVILLISVLATVSTVYALQLRALNTTIARQASISNQQRDAALATLGDLTYQLQRKFDDPESYIEEIQQSTLEIALRGLEKMEGLAGQTSEGGLARAIALRRLGETLYRLEQTAPSIDCLHKSESILRELLQSEPENKDVILAFADTTIAGHECAVDTEIDVPSQLARLVEAYQFCQRLSLPDSEVAAKTSWLLACQAKYQLMQDQFAEANESLAKGRQLLLSYWDGYHLPEDTRLRDSILRTELSSIDMLRLEHQDFRDSANRIGALLASLPDYEVPDSMILETQLSLLENLGLLTNASSSKISSQWHSLNVFYEQLFGWARADVDQYAVVTEQIALLAIDRLDLSLDSAARDLLLLRAALAETRLEQSSNDPVALLEQFDSHSALASIEFDVGTDASNRQSFDYCLKALQEFDGLAVSSTVTGDEWHSLVDIFDMLAKLCKSDRANQGELCRQLQPMFAMIERWLADQHLVSQADADDLAACRQRVQQIARIIKL